MSIWSIDLDFVKQRECYVELAGAKLFDLFVRAGLLSTKLIAWEAEYREALVLIFFVGLFEAGVLFGIAAFGGDVYDQDHFPLVRSERGVFSINILQLDVVNGLRRGKVCVHETKTKEQGKYFHVG